jgi:hypothetical protein
VWLWWGLLLGLVIGMIVLRWRVLDNAYFPFFGDWKEKEPLDLGGVKSHGYHYY